MKPLLPTLKERKRFIVYQVITARPLDQEVSGDLVSRCNEFLGTFGAAEAGILSIHHDEKTQSGILRCSHRSVSKVRLAMTMTTHIGRTPVLVRTLGISGILAKSKRFLPEKIVTIGG